MTGWHLHQGYCSGPHPDWNEWVTRMVEEIVPSRLADIKALCLAVGVAEDGDGDESLDDYLQRYVDRNDSTISLVNERDDDGTFTPVLQVMQLASGGGRSRDVKECIRAAVTAFFILEGIKVGLTVGVTVA